MERLRFPNEISASERTNTRWSYWSPGLDGIVEVGTLIGSDVGLPTHFHCENQITFVHSGRRRFLIGGEVITVLPGQGALIAAGVAHRSLAEPSGVACFNVHVPAGEYDLAAMMHTAERMWGGAATVLALIVVGQMFGSLAFNRFGLLGVPQQPANLMRLAGAGFLIFGVVLIRA